MTEQRATHHDVERLAADAFVPTTSTRIGAEVEWLVFDTSDHRRHVTADHVAHVAAGALPDGSTITVEPGAQLELVTRPFEHPEQLLRAIGDAVSVLVERFEGAGLQLVALGLDPIRPPQRSLFRPRYDAMHSYFEHRWPSGLRMMNLTASLQLNVDFGPDPAATWGLSAVLAPVLAAMFANSPLADAGPPMPVSHRQNVWAEMDPSRTSAVGSRPQDWSIYILNSQVMMRELKTGVTPQLEPLSVAQWLQGAEPPSVSELKRHITTLFPPVRPRGFLEFRMLDALPVVGRAAAIATVWALLSDPNASSAAGRLCAEMPTSWDLSNTRGLGDEQVRQAAAALLEVAAESLREESPDLSAACLVWKEQRVLSPPYHDTAASHSVAGLLAAATEPG